MRPLRLLLPAVLAMLLACSGCTDQPKLQFVGSPAPDFTLQDADHKVSLHDYRGKVVVLNLWASWCLPCIEEIPDLDLLQQRMGDKVTILAVSYDDTESDYHRFIRQHKMDFVTVHDRDRQLRDLYKPTGPPETYVIDRSGKILRKFIGPQHWGSDEIVNYLKTL